MPSMLPSNFWLAEKESHEDWLCKHYVTDQQNVRNLQLVNININTSVPTSSILDSQGWLQRQNLQVLAFLHDPMAVPGL